MLCFWGFSIIFSISHIILCMYRVCEIEKPKVHDKRSSLLPQKTLPLKCLTSHTGIWAFLRRYQYVTFCLTHALRLLWSTLGRSCYLAHPDWEEFCLRYIHVDEILHFCLFVFSHCKDKFPLCNWSHCCCSFSSGFSCLGHLLQLKPAYGKGSDI